MGQTIISAIGVYISTSIDYLIILIILSQEALNLHNQTKHFINFVDLVKEKECS